MTNAKAIAILDLVVETAKGICNWARFIPNETISEAHEMAVKAMEAQEWIPCKKRLPELDEYVLISKKPTKISGSKWSVVIAARTADPRSGKIQWRDSGFGVIQDDKVLAWKPRPEPYKAESEEV